MANISASGISAGNRSCPLQSAVNHAAPLIEASLVHLGTSWPFNSPMIGSSYCANLSVALPNALGCRRIIMQRVRLVAGRYHRGYPGSVCADQQPPLKTKAVQEE
jgi:hypothetical protein